MDQAARHSLQERIKIVEAYFAIELCPQSSGVRGKNLWLTKLTSVRQTYKNFQRSIFKTKCNSVKNGYIYDVIRTQY